MSDYLEKFEKMRIAGSLASKTLDMITAVSYTHLTLPTNREV